jgi:hypothetical protein
MAIKVSSYLFFTIYFALNCFSQVKIVPGDAYNSTKSNKYLVATISDSLRNVITQPGEFKNWNFSTLAFNDSVYAEKSNSDWFSFPFNLSNEILVENFSNNKYYVGIKNEMFVQEAYSSNNLNQIFVGSQIVIPSEIDFSNEYSYSNKCYEETDTILNFPFVDSVLFMYEQDNLINPIAFGNFTLLSGEKLSSLLIHYITFRQKYLTYHDINSGWINIPLNNLDTVSIYRWFIPGFGSIPAFIEQVNGQLKLFYTADKPFVSSLRDVEIKDDLMVFPNPANNFININSKQKYSTIKIADAMCRTLLNFDMKNFTKSFDISSIPDGIYFIILNNSEQTITQKFIKN